MRIVVLGWGSLIEEPGSLRLRTGWLAGGPKLPIELSRLSRGRGHLTFVIDERHERRVPTQYAFSRYSGLPDAVADLACREECAASSIGFVKAAEHSRRHSRSEVWAEIRAWLLDKPIDAAVWTDLPPRFPVPFTLEAAVKHWRGLPAEKMEAARTYVREAPTEVDTDLRRRLANEGLA